MSKIISIHGSACQFDCEHSNICYHKDKDVINKSIDMDKFILQSLEDTDNTVYISVCSDEELDKGIFLLSVNKKVNITIPMRKYVEMAKYYKCIIDEYKDRMQVTVYSLADIMIVGNDTQKLMLINDDISFKLASKIIEDAVSDITYNIHFPLYQEYFEANKSQLSTLVSIWSKCDNDTITLDSCLENFMLHGKCVYQDNYVDINYDGTYRKCVFEKEGFIITDNMSINDMLYHKCDVDCIYNTLFGGMNE